MPPPAKLYLYQEIGDSLFGGGTSAASFIDEIKGAGKNPIDLHINSPGGSVFDGYAIFNALKRHTPGVTVYVDGLAASIASYIAMAGTAVFMADNAMLMIHLPSSGSSGGTAEEMRKDADILDMITNSLVDAYASRTGIPDDEIRKMLDEETWMDAKQALAFGFVDGITEPLEMAAKFDANALKNFKNVPDAVKERISKESMKAGNSAETKPETPPSAQRKEEPDAQRKEAPEVHPAETPENSEKPSIFARVKAAFMNSSEFLAQIESYKAQLEEKDQELAKQIELTAVATKSLTAALSDLDHYKSEESALLEAITKHETEAKTASDRAVDIVAAAGFPQEKLPAVQSEDAVKSAQQFLAEYEALPPAAKTEFLRANKEAIARANAELKKAKKQ